MNISEKAHVCKTVIIIIIIIIIIDKILFYKQNKRYP